MKEWFTRLFSFDQSNTGSKTHHPGHIDKAKEVDSQTSMSVDGVRGDSPIALPEHDLLGVDPFAKAIAKSISVADATDGLVYAINGAWGSGKSSVINLVLHHLSAEIEDGRLIATMFNPWWFSGSEALTISFFQEMRATVGKSLDEKAREAMASLGSRLSSAGPLLGGLASLFASPAAGAAVTGGVTLLDKLTKLDSTVDKEHRKLSASLRDSEKKFLIVLDDIDRLNTDDALQIFKLIKSVGRLPNVVYLMAFDRQLAEKMVAERFPAEGGSYLEKVIQGGFDLPVPEPDDLRHQLLATVSDVMGAPSEEKMSRFWNNFYDIVAPLLRTPRDVLRLSNAVKVSWPAVAEDADRADFLSIEALRVFLPSLHQKIRNNPEMLTGTQSKTNHDRASAEREYDNVFTNSAPEQQRSYAKRALRRLFPRLDAVWSNTWYGNSLQWQRDRLICSPLHFRTYFAFGVASHQITLSESNNLVQNAAVPGKIASMLRDFLGSSTRKGGTRAALALDELNARAEDIPEGDVQQFLIELFSVADDLNTKADVDRGFSISNNQLRIHWLLNNILERFDQSERSILVRTAAKSASLEWLISLTDRMKAQADKVDAQTLSREQLVDDETADWLYQQSIDRLRTAAASGELVKHPRVEGLLYRWKDRSGPEEVRTWTDSQLHNDGFVSILARDLIRESWSHGVGGLGGWLGDRVAKRTEYLHLQPLESMLDINRFKERVNQLLASPDISEIDTSVFKRFVSLPERNPERLG